ncbi:MAG: gliding motility-associated C-terminal domain-containing protein [Flavobacteriales bacterium]
MPPNVFSPNGDGQNDALVFPYLEFYASNTLPIFNRWGKTIFEKSNYQNNWKAEGYPDGVYFFVLTAGDQKYNETEHVIRH